MADDYRTGPGKQCACEYYAHIDRDRVKPTGGDGLNPQGPEIAVEIKNLESLAVVDFPGLIALAENLCALRRTPGGRGRFRLAAVCLFHFGNPIG